MQILHSFILAAKIHFAVCSYTGSCYAIYVVICIIIKSFIDLQYFYTFLCCKYKTWLLLTTNGDLVCSVNWRHCLMAIPTILGSVIWNYITCGINKTMHSLLVLVWTAQSQFTFHWELRLFLYRLNFNGNYHHSFLCCCLVVWHSG